MPKGKTKDVDLAEQLIAGTKQHLSNVSSLMLESGTFTPAQIESSLQTLVDLRKAVNHAKAAVKAPTSGGSAEWSWLLYRHPAAAQHNVTRNRIRGAKALAPRRGPPGLLTDSNSHGRIRLRAHASHCVHVTETGAVTMRANTGTTTSACTLLGS